MTEKIVFTDINQYSPILIDTYSQYKEYLLTSVNIGLYCLYWLISVNIDFLL